MSKLTKSVKITETAHHRLVEACEVRFGTSKIRFSDAIETLCNEEINRQEGDE
jgi:hypothetical protein